MGKYYFQTPSPDLDAISKRLVIWFKQNEYEVDSAKDDHCYLVQARKVGNLRTLTGTNIAFKIMLSPSETADEFVCDMNTGKWTANIAGAGVTALFTGGFTLLTGAVGAAWTYKVERDILDFMESTLKFKKIQADGEVAVSLDDASAPSPQPALQASATAKTLSAKDQAKSLVQTEIAKLAEAHHAGILTEEEFEAKTQHALSRECDYEVEILAKDRKSKLAEALTAGILSQAEYDSKVLQVNDAVRKEMQQKQAEERKSEQMKRLKAALDAGVLSEEEYQAKVASLG